ncbi:MAG: SMP-30/gluconolactonase/LRE family protein [Planctomycetaceae bacterium]|nr:SMP-30/gluconolactonase/LRE family protein [Planctomycetaceae bacterium]
MSRFYWMNLCLLMLVSHLLPIGNVSHLMGAEPPVYAPGLKVEGKVAFTEGPAWHAASGSVYFTDIENNRIMKRTAEGVVEVFRTPSGKANGLAFDKQGRLVACEGGNKRMTRTEADGSITVLTDGYQSKAYNAPNDLAIDPQGRIFFTDPRYGTREGMEILDDQGRAVEGVYRIDTNGQVKMVIQHEVDRPNGIAVSADGKFLYVADNNNDAVGKNRCLWRFAFDAKGEINLSSQKKLFDWEESRGPDGFSIGPDGKLYVTAGTNFPSATETNRYRSGVYVINHQKGGLEKFIAVPEDMITNCTWGGEDGKTLFITAGHKLWSLSWEAIHENQSFSR